MKRTMLMTALVSLLTFSGLSSYAADKDDEAPVAPAPHYGYEPGMMWGAGYGGQMGQGYGGHMMGRECTMGRCIIRGMARWRKRSDSAGWSTTDRCINTDRG